METRFYTLGTGYSEVPIDPTASTPMPTGLHMAAGKYVYMGVGYDCSQPGLYRFANRDTGIIQQRISYDAANIPAYIASISWLHMQGMRENGTTLPLTYTNMASIQAAAKWHNISMLCGYIADFTRQLLGQLGKQARIVHMMTAETPNGYDDGHIVFEEKSSGEWRLWDITNGVYFTDSAGKHLSLKEIIEVGVPACNIVRISEKRSSYSVSLTLDFGLWDEFWGRTDANVRTWCERMYQIPSVKSGSAYYCYVPAAHVSRTSYMMGLGFNVQTKSVWDTAWYS